MPARRAAATGQRLRRPGPAAVSSQGSGGAKDRQFVTALARGLEVLRAFRPGDGALGNQEIALRTGLPKPTVSRLTHTLTRLGYLSHAPELEKYRLGAGVLALGYALLAGMDIRERARPLMQALADATNAAVSLGMRDRLSMVYLETCRGPSAITLRLDVGSRIPLATSAMGRAFIAAQPVAERARLLREIERQDPKNFPRNRRGLEQAVRQLAARGFVESIGDWQADVHAIGVPLVEPDGAVVFALTCGGAGFQLPQEKLEREIGPRLVALARTLGSASPARQNR